MPQTAPVAIPRAFCGIPHLPHRLARRGEPLTLEIEAQDEGVLASILNWRDEHTEIVAGTPLGVICEEEADVATAARFNPTGDDIYADGEQLGSAFLWQAYLKKKDV